jgi:hypothetical protein
MDQTEQKKSSKWKHALGIGAGLAVAGLAAYGGHQIYKRQKFAALKGSGWGGPGWQSYSNNIAVDRLQTAHKNGTLQSSTLFDAGHGMSTPSTSGSSRASSRRSSIASFHTARDD